MSHSYSNPPVMKSLWSAVSLLAVAAGLSGCTANYGDVATSGIAIPASTGGTIVGNVHGGQQPVSGSVVQLWTVGAGGYQSAASPLGSSVKTNANGGFTLGSYTCPSNSYAYITAAGGDPQISSGAQTGSGNTAIALMAALGPCNTTNLNSATFIQINEVTTVAAAFAMAQFGSFTASATLVSGASTQTPVDTFGTSSTNLQGIANAMQVAQILAGYGVGVSTAASGNPATTTPANVSVEYGQVNTLANILALCVNSTGVSSTPCSPIITAATPAGGTAPADTIQIALNLAKNPTIGLGAQGDLNNSAYNAITGTPPFQPYDSAAPNDWTIGYAISLGSFDSRWIAMDQFGNAWVSTSGAGLVEIDPTTGNTYSIAKVCTAGCTTATPTTTSISASYEVAVDTANNAWFSDTTSGNIYKIAGSSSVGVEAPGLITGNSGAAADTVVAGPAATTGVNGAAGNLQAIVVDGSNNIWASVSGTSGGNTGVLVEVANGTTTATTGGPLTTSPFGMAVDMSNQSKFGNSTLSGGGSFVYSVDSAGCSGLAEANGGTSDNETAGSIAMDFTTSAPNGTGTYAAGAATPLNYLSDATCSTSTKIYNSTTNTFSASPYGIAFDNNNAMWVVDQNYTTLATGGAHYSLTKMAPQNYSNYSAFTGAAVGGTSTAPGITFTSIPGTTGGLNVPYYLAMDGNSAAWVGNSTGASLSGFTNSGTAISPATGFSGGTCSSCTYTARKSSGVRGVAVDGSGNVLIANTTGTYVYVVVGVAGPTVTPLSLGIKNGTLASKP
jgi:hypothetical protein